MFSFCCCFCCTLKQNHQKMLRHIFQMTTKSFLHIKKRNNYLPSPVRTDHVNLPRIKQIQIIFPLHLGFLLEMWDLMFESYWLLHIFGYWTNCLFWSYSVRCCQAAKLSSSRLFDIDAELWSNMIIRSFLNGRGSPTTTITTRYRPFVSSHSFSIYGLFFNSIVFHETHEFLHETHLLVGGRRRWDV